MQLNEEQMAAATHPLGSPACLIAGAGSGKCLAYGTLVVMYDCSIKPVQDVKNGDLLLGPDGAPRRVRGVTTGTDAMFRVTPVKGVSWGCNSHHILSLRVSSKHKQKTYGKYMEMSVRDYLNRTPHFKKKVVKLWRPPLIEFPHTEVPVDPYFLGLWLGDGDTSLDSVTITTADSQVVEHLMLIANEWGLLVTPSLSKNKCPRYRLSHPNNQGRTNPLINVMRSLGLGAGKRIPRQYLRNSVEVRWHMLAGLLDSDGSYDRGGWDYVSKIPELSEDLAFLARSLGLAAYVTPCDKFCQTGGGGTYYRVSISGDTFNIPTKLERKQSRARYQIKSVLRTGFTITSEGLGTYYGFELDGDGLFLLGDFTVTHNTSTMTERVCWLIEQGVKPQRICSVTFTNKASQELLERVMTRLSLDESSNLPKVSTIHSLALSAIRKSPLGFGLQDKVTPLDDYDQSQMIRRIVERTVDVKEKGISLGSYVYTLIEKVNFHRARNIGFCIDYTDEVHEKAQLEHAGYHAMEPFDLQIWKLYEEEKQKSGTIDFSDMLCLFNRRVEQDPVWRTQLQKSFDVVLVDEAQDLSIPQWGVVNGILAPSNPNIMTVGDLSQSIMSFNGSAPHLLREFSEGWRGVIPSLYKIARNHRSLPRIVYLANHIQAKMNGVIPIKMQAFRGNEENRGTVELTRASTPQDIAMLIAGEIARDNKRSKGHVAFKDNAILIRSARQVMDIENALVRHRIPYVVRGGRGLLQTEEVRDVISYLRLITNPKDFTALVRAVGVPKRGIGDVALERIRKTAQEKHEGDLILGCAAIDKLSLFVSSLQNIQRYRDYPVQALDQIMIAMDYNKYIENKYKREPDKVKSKMENIDRFKELVRGLSEDQKMSTEDLVFQITLERAREDDKEGQVTVSTIHCSPPDEPVLTTKGYRVISELDSNSDRLYSYIPKCNQLARGQRNGAMDYHGGYKFSVKSRYYKGNLVVINTPYSHTRVTPEHRVRVSFSEDYYGKWVVYLMRRGDWWRIGTCTSASIPYKSGGVPGRLAAEKGDSGWVLGVFSERNAALAAEIDYQVRYGIPALCFEKWKNAESRETVYSIHEALKDVVCTRAKQLLIDKGLLLDAPLYRRAKNRTTMLNACWFDTVAANLLSGYMLVPVAGELDFRAAPPNTPRPCVATMEREYYEGPVFSLDVLPHHYYVSGGIVVHNSAKGLEWPRVFVTNLVEGSLPHRFSMGSAEELEEERRLLYVAATRAQDSVTLCVHAMEMNGTDTRRVAPSRFLIETGIMAEE